MLQPPDIFRILPHRAIAGKPSDARHVEDRPAIPLALLGVEPGYLRLGVDVGSKIREQKIFVGIQQHVANPSEQARLVGTETIGAQRVEDPAEAWITIVKFARPIASLRDMLLDLLGG